MKKLILVKDAKINHAAVPDDVEDFIIKDCNKIIAICEKRGFDIDTLTAYNAWLNYSAQTNANYWIWSTVIEQATFESVFQYCDIEGEENQHLTTLEKFQQIKVACKAGFQMLVDQHLGTRVHVNGVQSQCAIEEYVVLMEGGSLNPFGTVYHRPEDFTTTCKQIIENNSIYELFLYIDNVKVNYKVIHYDFALLIDEAWKLLSEFGKVEE